MKVGAKPALVFLHGWGCDARVWDALSPLLADFAHVHADRGYFGPQAPLERPAGPVVAVGHSLGAMLLARAWEDVPLVAVNGFTRFCGADGVPPRVLARMRARLAQDPATVLADFCARIAAPPPPAIVAPERLAADLAVLADEAPPPARSAPILALHALDDPLLPAGLRGALPGAVERADGGHMLPLTQAAWVADHIRRFAA